MSSKIILPLFRSKFQFTIRGSHFNQFYVNCGCESMSHRQCTDRIRISFRNSKIQKRKESASRWFPEFMHKLCVIQCISISFKRKNELVNFIFGELFVNCCPRFYNSIILRFRRNKFLRLNSRHSIAPHVYFTASWRTHLKIHYIQILISFMANDERKMDLKIFESDFNIMNVPARPWSWKHWINQSN